MKSKVIETVNPDYLNKARFLLNKKYNSKLVNKYNILKINEILSNSKTRLVSVFKDYLLFDDFSEFFKRYYNGKESKNKIKKISNFFSKGLFIYPNYASMEEGKYVLCCLIKKQMILNKQKRNKYYLNNELKKNFFEKKNKVFNNAIYEDIFAQQKSESFIDLLFGLDNKNKENNSKIENNENDDINKIINAIELNENLYLKKSKEKILVNTLFSNNNRKNNNLIRKNNSKHNFLLFVNKTNTIDKITKGNNFNEETKDSSKGDSNNINVTKKLVNNKSMIYHRKVRSTLSSNLSKLELPSNKNLINILKISNAASDKENKDKNELYNKTQRDKININKIPIKKLTKEKTVLVLNNNQYKNNTKREHCKLTRNNQSNMHMHMHNNTSVLFRINKSIYIKNKVIKNNMSNKNISGNVNDENKEINNRKYSKPYSKPKCIYKDNKSSVISQRTYYNNLKEVILIERLK